MPGSMVLFKGTLPVTQNLPMGPCSQRLYYLSSILLGIKVLHVDHHPNPSRDSKKILVSIFCIFHSLLLYGCSFSILVAMTWVLQVGMHSVHQPRDCEALSFLVEKRNLVKLTLATWASREAAVATSGICPSSVAVAVFCKQLSIPPSASKWSGLGNFACSGTVSYFVFPDTVFLRFYPGAILF